MSTVIKTIHLTRDMNLFFGAGVTPAGSSLIKQAGGYILLQSGGRILLQ